MVRKEFIANLLRSYEIKKGEIKERLMEFEEVGKGSDKDLFAELCFCILTPQSKAKVCDRAIKRLVDSKVLFDGTEKEIMALLEGVRFPNNKARYLVETRNFFNIDGKVKIKETMKSFKDNKKLREWLVKRVKGVGFKEASHFLRNIGRGRDLAILDRHVLKNMRKLGIVRGNKNNLSRKEYLKYEDRMKKFARDVNIPLDELDLLLWSEETGEIFK